MVSRRLLGITATILLTAASICYIACNVQSSWGTRQYSVLHLSVGLWQGCLNRGCTMLNNHTFFRIFIDWRLHTARALMALVCISTPCAVGCLIFVVVKDRFEPRFLSISKNLSVLSFVLGLIGMAIGIRFFTSGTQLTLSGTNIEMGGASLTMGEAARNSIIGVGLNFVGALIACVIQPK
ncbi:unnamed protein product [Rotaria socialis]|uniref:Uncharacterized protein n=2 Tax=Rotaria socialis TaxID=392032 RepID=A0A817L4M1_9BILA|nr:unnamed protein product [Rotaria socialis]CAF3323554.1 unnamed protein product [Rotaria socialis]